MEWLISRPVFIALAVTGALVAAATAALRTGGALSDQGFKYWNWVAYAFMAASIVIFIVAGFSPGGHPGDR